MLMKNLEELGSFGKRGDWCFLTQDTYIGIRYGEGELDIVTIPVALTQSGCNWYWDGNKECPTISPSILVHANEGFTKGWHGFLRKGVLVDA